MALFEFLEAHRTAYWDVFIALLLGLAWSIGTELANWPAPIRRRRWAAAAYAILIALLVFWGRFPGWMLPEQNPDEGQALATAITFAHDPRFWISVDAGTHGPMVTVPLLLLKLFGAKIGFVGGRAVGTALLAGALVLTYGLCRARFGTLPAALAVLPVATSLALTLEPDFVAYNGEIPIVFLLALGGWLFQCSLSHEGPGRRRFLLFAAGLSIGLIPWAKLQGVPSAVVAIILVAAAVRPHRADLRIFVLGVLVPSVVFLAHVFFIGAFEDFWTGYVRFASMYGDPGAWVFRIGAFYRFLLVAPHLDMFVGPLVAALGILAAGHAVTPIRRAAYPADIAASAALAIASLYEVYRPGKGFAHYLILLIVPIVLLTASLFQSWAAAARGRIRWLLVAGYALLTLAWPAPQRFNTLMPFEAVANFREVSKPCAPINIDMEDAVARDILRYALPGDRLLVWGWMASLHVYTQLPQAVRYGDQWQIGKYGRERRHFAEMFVRDFDAAPVPLVVDAVGPLADCFRFREAEGHESFPWLAERIRQDYELVWDHQGFRLFVRKDRLKLLRTA